jgi:predicted LPLAT superfamily acyltransferase
MNDGKVRKSGSPEVRTSEISDDDAVHADPGSTTARTPSHRPWTGTSRGGGLGTALVGAFARWGGRDLCYLGVIPPALWFWWRDAAARRAITSYWRRLRPDESAWRRTLRVPWHFWTFARSLADRLIIAHAPGSLRYERIGLDIMQQAMAHPQGCILLSAHLGSFELAARWLVSHAERPINLVLLDGEDPRVQAHLRRHMGERPYRVIDLRDPTAAALAIVAALGQGETCCMLGDRSAGGDDGLVAVDFLGGTVRFPIGPFVAAALTGALIVPTFCVRSGWRTWLCRADAPWRIEAGPRRERQERLRAAVQCWADRLAAEVRRHPWQWNNYYDLWA